MKKVASFIATLMVTTISFAQNGPKIDFAAKDNTIDYGTVSKGDNGVKAFEFTNTGDAPLMITSVQSTAGISIVSKPSAAIMPGKSGKIEVKFNMASGPIRKTITVETNAVNYDEGRIALKIKGDVAN
ncbi:DUF1573 domain-containing protein [Flavobacterium sp. LS1R49]|uniref:DUF1573 domain-containing protein n=1 Tax=Flavobacterium shii TaxID=2987687 RepID=A0A9X2YVA0_9FLAO|nr:DUF1573 domain-containing protein [Flavobacterium shii]MCV9928353.1 DUF1573 domain-containing protein [Flavobacterium shii]